MTELLGDFEDKHLDLFEKQPIQLQHKLAETGLFTKQALAELISRYPETHYNVNTMGFDHDNPQWREGDISGLTGEDAIEGIKQGRLWLNLRRVTEVDPVYAEVLNDLFSEFEGAIPNLKTFKRSMGILISSPNVQVFYHADVPGQALWQISGQKKVFVYPNAAPFLPRKDLEGIVLGETEEEIPYEPWFDDYARVYDLKAGEMLHWPLNAPHRVINEDCLNISVTTEYWTNEIRKSYAVNYGNGILRRKTGYQPQSSSVDNLSVYPKAALTMAWKRLKLSQQDSVARKVSFRIDPSAPRGIVDIPAYIKAV